MKQKARSSVFTRLGQFAVARPKTILVATAAFFVVSGMAGNGLLQHLSTGGFDDTSSQATRAQQTLERVFGQGNPDVVLMVQARRGGVDDPAVSAEGTALTRELAAQPGVTQAASYWTLSNAPPLRSKDGSTALVFARVPGNQNHANDVMKRLSPRFTRDDGTVRVRVGGFAEVFRQVTGQV
jgi:putative drug exporter of the RND superfamily